MKRRPPRSTRTDTLFPYTTLFRSLQDVEVRIVDTAGGPMVVTHLIVDTRDAMGANAVNSMAEKLAPHIETWTGGRVYLRILSNLADRRLARARATWTCETIGGADVRDGILSAYRVAAPDPSPAAPHHKGITKRGPA